MPGYTPAHSPIGVGWGGVNVALNQETLSDFDWDTTFLNQGTLSDFGWNTNF